MLDVKNHIAKMEEGLSKVFNATQAETASLSRKRKNSNSHDEQSEKRFKSDVIRHSTMQITDNDSGLHTAGNLKLKGSLSKLGSNLDTGKPAAGSLMLVKTLGALSKYIDETQWSELVLDVLCPMVSDKLGLKRRLCEIMS